MFGDEIKEDKYKKWTTAMWRGYESIQQKEQTTPLKRFWKFARKHTKLYLLSHPDVSRLTVTYDNRGVGEGNEKKEYKSYTHLFSVMNGDETIISICIRDQDITSCDTPEACAELFGKAFYFLRYLESSGDFDFVLFLYKCKCFESLRRIMYETSNEDELVSITEFLTILKSGFS